MNTMKITVPSPDRREGVSTLKAWLAIFSEAEVVEIVHRYCNTQDQSKKYRVKSAEQIKALKAMAKEQGWEL